MINNETTLNRVIGYPLAHTQSPLLHNTVYQLLGCNAVMLAQPTEDLSSMIQVMKTVATGLVAVTMPFKEKIVPYLDEVSIEVESLKAANTVICRHGKLLGYNTDVHGVEYALRNQILSDKNILMIGAGGAARAAAYYLQKNRANLMWLNRTYSHALSMQEMFGGKIVAMNEVNNLSIDIIINSTPVGMFPDVNSSPLPDYLFQSHHVVFDMVYNPIDTALLKRAKLHGAICISGLDMFVGQGLKQIELWLDKSIFLSEMIDPIKAKLKESQIKSEGII